MPCGWYEPARPGRRADGFASTPTYSARTASLCASIISWSNVSGVRSTSAGSTWTSRWWICHQRVMGSVPPVLRPKCRRCAGGNPKAPLTPSPRFAARAALCSRAAPRTPMAGFASASGEPDPGASSRARRCCHPLSGRHGESGGAQD